MNNFIKVIKNFFKENFTKAKVLPLSLTAFLIMFDQVVKAIIVKVQPLHPALIRDVFNNDFFKILHVRNKAIAFSIGENFPEFIKPALFIVVPILVLLFLIWYYFKSNEFTNVQRWAAAGIIGGGMGNIIDRIFRPDGVVDFISIKLYGFLGFEYWPTFNIADSSVVVCCILLIVTMFIPFKKIEKEANK